MRRVALGGGARAFALLRTRPLLCAGLLLIVIVLAELVNRLVLVRLYPAFHLGLGALVLALAPLVGEALARALGQRPSAAPPMTARAAAVPLGLFGLSLARGAAVRAAPVTLR